MNRCFLVRVEYGSVEGIVDLPIRGELQSVRYGAKDF